MREKLLFITLFIFGLINTAAAQNATFRVQGHECPDIEFSQQEGSSLRSTNGEDKDFTFDDITFWVGEGEKRAALVIDWYDDKGNTLVWGFRWDGTATGYDMICAVAEEDPRFLFLTHTTNIGMTAAGFGYDLNKSGGQHLIFEGDTENPYYPMYGTVTTDAYNYDDWTNDDPADHWQSGWYTGYWSYFAKDSQEDDFSYSAWGCSSRILEDGSWDGWGYQDGWESMDGVTPRAPYVSATSPFTMYNSYWSEMGKDGTHMSTINTKTARHADEFSEKWKLQLSSGWWINGAQPIIVNGNVYLAVNDVIMMIDSETGEILKETTLAGSCGYFSMVAYGEGKIFVPLGNGILQAFNAETLESIWVTESRSGYQQLCPVIYHDGYVYTGMWRAGSPASGTYYCVSAKDEDPRNTNEIKEIVWESDDTGFYWSGGTVVGDYILFGGDSGYLQSRHRLTGELIDSYEIASELETSTIRSGISYDETTGRVYFTGKESQKIYSVKVNEDGTLDNESVLSTQGMGQATTIPVVYNGRLYATSGTMTSGGGMDVLDANTMEHLYSVDLGGISQSTPLLTTGYATPENNNTVYLYVCLNNASGTIVCIKDFEGNTEPIVQFTYTPSSVQYCTHSLIADEKGTIYYKNDAKYLFALESTPTIDVTSVTLDNEEITLAIGNTFELTATVNPDDASNKTISWTSSNEEVATVDENGIVTALTTGETTITVTTEDGEFTAACKVTVVIPVEGIELDESELTLDIEDTYQLTVTFTPENATEKGVIWTSNNTEVATVNDEGVVTAVSTGVANITVESVDGGFTAECIVTVNDPLSIDGDALQVGTIFSRNGEFVFRNLDGYTFTIYSVSGQALKEVAVSGNEFIFNAALPSGTYILKGNNQKEQVSVKLILK